MNYKPKCSVCKTVKNVRQLGLKFVCDKPECLETLTARALKKGRASLKKAANEEKKARAKKKFELLTMSSLCSKVQANVNAYLRAVDSMHGYGCVSCPSSSVHHAGHFYHAGSKWQCSRFRFSHIIIHGQCISCNHFSGGGNVEGYTEGIKSRYGEDYLLRMRELKNIAERGELKPLSREEVLEINKWHLDQTKLIKQAASEGRVIPDARMLDQWGVFNGY